MLFSLTKTCQVKMYLEFFFVFFLVYRFFVFESSSIIFDFFVLILFRILLVFFFCFSGLGMFGLLFRLLYLRGFMFLFLIIVLILNVPFYTQKLSFFFVLVRRTCFFVFCSFHFISNNFFFMRSFIYILFFIGCLGFILIKIFL